MSDDRPIDYAAARERFPWIGLGPPEETDLASRYREIMAQGRIGREIVEAVDEIRNTA